MDSNEARAEASPLPFLHLIQTLKHIPRTGWLMKIENPESVASHSFRVAFLGLLAPPPLDSKECMFIGLCHDLGKAIIGDMPKATRVPRETKRQWESLALDYIASLLRPVDATLADKVRDAWLDYEHGRTPEGRFMKEMDKFECLVQAHEYEQSTYGTKDFGEFQGQSSKITSPLGRDWLKFLQEERNEHLSGREDRLPIILVTGNFEMTKAQRDGLSADLDVKHISVPDLLESKSKDKTYPHADALGGYLKKDIFAPADMLVGLIKGELEACESGGSCYLIHGFPKNADQFIQFEKHVQKTNQRLQLRSASRLDTERMQERHFYSGPNLSMDPGTTGFELSMLSGPHVKEVDCDEPEDSVYGQLKSAVSDLIRQQREPDG